MKRMLFLLILLTMTSGTVFSDIARPGKSPNRVPKPKSVETTLMIRLDQNATEATLLIPKTHLNQLRAELEQLDNDSNDAAAVTSEKGFSRNQTIVGGMFLSLAIIFGGMWFARSGRTSTMSGKVLVILAVAAGAGSAATLIYANVGPPPSARSITGKMFSEAVHTYKFGSGKIRLELRNDDGDRVELIVPDPQDKPKTGE